MAITETERPVRVRPRAPKPGSDEGRVWAVAMRQMLHFFQMTGQAAQRSTKRTARCGPHAERRFAQRCAVRVTYTRNKTRGQWGAHGRYLVRDSAAGHADGKSPGFNAVEESVDVARALQQWQQSRDERLFKLIVSPEFGERIDLTRLTRDLLGRMERDIGRPLEWVAVTHFNTEHPHVHVALRGVAAGQPLRLAPEYIKRGIRGHAEDLCTAELGYRTTLDAAEARWREVDQQRFTTLDRALQSRGIPETPDREDSAHFLVMLGAGGEHLRLRLAVLRTMGLAESAVDGSTWRIRSDFEPILRAMQKAADRQKMLAANAALLSDERLPFQVTSSSSINVLEGRVLGHMLDDSTARVHMLLEGTDASIHFIQHNQEIEAARQRGDLRPNHFVRIERSAARKGMVLIIHDFGDAEQFLSSEHLGETLRSRSEPLPEAGRWGGWLGRYHEMVRRQLDGAGSQSLQREGERGGRSAR